MNTSSPNLPFCYFHYSSIRLSSFLEIYISFFEVVFQRILPPAQQKLTDKLLHPIFFIRFLDSLGTFIQWPLNCMIFCFLETQYYGENCSTFEKYQRVRATIDSRAFCSVLNDTIYLSFICFCPIERFCSVLELCFWSSYFIFCILIFCVVGSLKPMHLVIYHIDILISNCS